MDNSLQQTPPPRKQLIIELLVIMGWLYVIPLISSIAFYFGFNPISPGGGDVASVLARGAQTSLLLYLIWSGGEPFARFGFKKPQPSDLAWTIPLTLVIYMMDLAIQKINPFAILSYGPTPFYMVTTSSIVAIIASVIFEETLIRSYLITRLEQIGWKTAYALSLSVVLFIAIHLFQGWWTPVSTGVFGLLFGLFFIITRRIWPLIVAHSIINILLALQVQDFFMRMFRR